MAETIQHTNYRLTGPWLLDSNDLDSLDQVLLRVSALLGDLQARKIRDKVEEMTRELTQSKADSGIFDEETPESLQKIKDHVAYLHKLYEKETTPTVEALLRNKRTIRGKSLREIREYSEIDLSRTVSLSIEFAVYPYAEVAFRFTVESGKLSIEGGLTEYREVTDAFNALRNWALLREPPRWQIKWMQHAWTAFPVVIFSAAIGLLVMALLSRGTRDQLRPVVESLLKGGIDATKVPKVLEILLREDFGIPLTPVVTPLYPLRWELMLVSVLFFAYYGRPRAAIGIGPTLRTPGKWRRWLKWVSWIAPGAVICAIALPRVSEWLIAQFK